MSKKQVLTSDRGTVRSTLKGKLLEGQLPEEERYMLILIWEGNPLSHCMDDPKNLVEIASGCNPSAMCKAVKLLHRPTKNQEDLPWASVPEHFDATRMNFVQHGDRMTEQSTCLMPANSIPRSLVKIESGIVQEGGEYRLTIQGTDAIFALMPAKK